MEWLYQSTVSFKSISAVIFFVFFINSVFYNFESAKIFLIHSNVRRMHGHEGVIHLIFVFATDILGKERNIVSLVLLIHSVTKKTQ